LLVVSGAVAVGVEGLLERDDALRAVREALAAGRSGRGSALCVLGPAGIGKSSVLAAVRSLAGQSGFTVFSASGGELEREFPFGVMRQAFAASLRAMSLRDRRALMKDGAEVVAGLFGVGGSSPVRAIEGAAASSGLFWLAANFAERNPVLVAVDDAQWADAGSLAALVYLARRVSDLALLLVVAWRSDMSRTAPELEHLRGLSHELVLPVLSARACVELAKRTLPAATESFCDACQRLTGGNPFLIEELVREAHSRALTPDTRGALALAELGPPRVERSVALRLADIPTQAMALARALSVLGVDRPPFRGHALS
jgi:predicted ATPase